MSTYHKIPTVSLTDVEFIEQPPRDISLNMDSPALEVFTDFVHRMPLMLERNTTVDNAIEIMRRTHVRLKLVIDSNEAFLGVITMADLFSVKVARAIQATGLKREDLSVEHVMTHRSNLHAMELEALSHACIGDVLTTMEDVGVKHVLVVDHVGGSVRGIISASDIARALHVPINISSKASSFADIFHALKA